MQCVYELPDLLPWSSAIIISFKTAVKGHYAVQFLKLLWRMLFRSHIKSHCGNGKLLNFVPTVFIVHNVHVNKKHIFLNWLYNFAFFTWPNDFAFFVCWFRTFWTESSWALSGQAACTHTSRLQILFLQDLNNLTGSTMIIHIRIGLLTKLS